ncbi:MAG: hypothetical protein J6K58_03675 [Lachnospiraceae bacterium]|nr:hypothetical protein [Lachnospiraceae bacterium]
MKRKMIPIILMLAAGAVTSIITFIKDYELIRMLWTLLIVLIIFYLLGAGIKRVLDLFDDQIKEAEEKEEEGSVIEKELGEEEQNIKDTGEKEE